MKSMIPHDARTERRRRSKDAELASLTEELSAADAALGFPDEHIGSTTPPSAAVIGATGVRQSEEAGVRPERIVARQRAKVATRQVHADRRAQETQIAATRETGAEHDYEEQLAGLEPAQRARVEEGPLSPRSMTNVGIILLMVVGEMALTKIVFDVLAAPGYATWLMTGAVVIALVGVIGKSVGVMLRQHAEETTPPRQRKVLLGLMVASLVVAALTTYYLADIRAVRFLNDQDLLISQGIGWSFLVSPASALMLFVALQLMFICAASLLGYRAYEPSLSGPKALHDRLARARRATARARRREASALARLQRAQAYLDAAEGWAASQGLAMVARTVRAIALYYQRLSASSGRVGVAAALADQLPDVPGIGQTSDAAARPPSWAIRLAPRPQVSSSEESVSAAPMPRNVQGNGHRSAADRPYDREEV